MQVLITHGHAARTRVFMLSRWQLAAALLAALALAVALAAAVLHAVVPPVAAAVGAGAAVPEQERYLRENLDAMAQKVGEMQAKLVRLEAVSERVSGLAGLKPDDLPPMPSARAASAAAAPAAASGGGRGGPFVPAATPSIGQLDAWLGALDAAADQHADLCTFIESRLLEARLQSFMIPSTRPVDGPVASGFGFRTDPFHGRAALHSGLDFPADTGTTIVAAAGGVVVNEQVHPQYGHMVEIDHGRGLVTRYAHTSRVLVKAGDLVRRGQPIARVGSTGRSTGPHLHFEVRVEGVPHDPARFLAFRGSDPDMALVRGRRGRHAPAIATAGG